MSEQYGIKISQEGSDVVTESDPDSLVFSSEYPTVTIRERRDASVTTDQPVSLDPVGYGETTISHDYGYIPFVIAFFETPDGVDSGYEGTLFNVPGTVDVPNDTLGSGELIATFTVGCEVTATEITVYAYASVTNNPEFLPTYIEIPINFRLLICMEEVEIS